MFIAPSGQYTLCYFGVHVHRIKSEEKEKENMDLAVALENRRPLDVNFGKGVGGRDLFTSTHMGCYFIFLLHFYWLVRRGHCTCHTVMQSS